jgi:hypothetical protein
LSYFIGKIRNYQVMSHEHKDDDDDVVVVHEKQEDAILTFKFSGYKDLSLLCSVLCPEQDRAKKIGRMK